jgi:hypothetical protein
MRICMTLLPLALTGCAASSLVLAPNETYSICDIKKDETRFEEKTIAVKTQYSGDFEGHILWDPRCPRVFYEWDFPSGYHDPTQELFYEHVRRDWDTGRANYEIVFVAKFTRSGRAKPPGYPENAAWFELQEIKSYKYGEPFKFNR